jgi:ribosomal-protein-serine acetyltransferase
MLPERVEDDGLVLRRWRVSDAEALHAVTTESASDLRLWVTWIDEVDRSVEGQRAFIAASEREWQGGDSLLLGIFVGGHIAGGCSLTARPGASGVWEIGYWLAPAFRGHGLATRAARLLTAAALADPNVHAVEIRHDKANLASGAVPRRLGYTFVGEAPNPVPAPADSGTDMVWSQMGHTAKPGAAAVARARPVRSRWPPPTDPRRVSRVDVVRSAPAGRRTGRARRDRRPRGQLGARSGAPQFRASVGAHARATPAGGRHRVSPRAARA